MTVSCVSAFSVLYGRGQSLCWEPVLDSCGEGAVRVTQQGRTSIGSRAHMFNDINPVPPSWELALCIWTGRWKEGRPLERDRCGGGSRDYDSLVLLASFLLACLLRTSFRF